MLTKQGVVSLNFQRHAGIARTDICTFHSPRKDINLYQCYKQSTGDLQNNCKLIY